MRKTAVVLAVAAVAAGVGAVPNDARRAEAEKEARAVLEKLTPDEKVQMLMMDNPEIKRVGIPRFHWWSEALHGYARSGLATVFPQAARTSTWTAILAGGAGRRRSARTHTSPRAWAWLS